MNANPMVATGTATPRPGAARDGDAANAEGSGGASFAGVMDAQSRGRTPAPAGSEAPRADASGAPSTQAEGEVDTSRDPAQDEAVAPLAEVDVEELLGLCAAPVAPAAAAEPPAACDADADAPAPEPAVLLNVVPPPALVTPERATEAGLDAAQRLSLEAAGAPSRSEAAAVDSRLAATLEKAAREPAEAGEAGAGGKDLPASAALGDARSLQRAPGQEALTGPGRPPELRAPPGTPAWADELGSRVTWMVERGEQVASLRLSPENLGPLEVRIAVREGETTIWFGAAQAETRAALEQSLPRLKEMLGASGLALANAGVFSETPRDPQRGFTAAALARAAHESGAEPGVATVTSVTRRGLVDLYA